MIRDYKDYIDIVQLEFPELTRLQIGAILRYGYHMYSYLIKNGCDVNIRSNDKDNPFLAYTGKAKKNVMDLYRYSNIKWAKKERAKAVIKDDFYDGYYYFGASHEMYDKIMRDKRNRSVKYISLENTTFTSIENELLHNPFIDFIFKVKYPIFVGLNFKKTKYKIDKNLVELSFINTNSTWHRKQQIHSTMD